MPDAPARCLKPCLLPGLLGWQTGFLAMLAGAVAWRAPAFAAALMVLLLAVTAPRDLRRFALLLLCCCLGACMMHASLPRQGIMPSWAAMPGRTVLAAGTVKSVSGLYGGRVRVLLEHVRPCGAEPSLPADRQEKLSRQLARAPLFAGSGFPRGYAAVTGAEGEVPGLVALTLDARDLGSLERPLPGQELRGALRFFPSGGSLNEHVPDPRAYWHDRDVWCAARPARSGGVPLWMEASGGKGLRFHAARLRERWRLGLLETLRRMDAGSGAPGEGEGGLSQSAAMLQALLFGDRSALSPQTAERFASAGLVHSLALSGQHLALAGLAAAAAVWLCSLFFHGMFLRAPRRVWTACAALPFAICYLYLGGAPFSLVRAACMLAAGAALLCMRRTSSPLDALFFAGLLIFTGWPPGVFDLSLQLSFSAVAGIICAAPLAGAACARLFPREGVPRRRLGHACRAVLRWTLTLLLASCAAQAAVFPVQTHAFGVVAPGSWLNLIWLPLLAFVTLPCAAVGLALNMAGAAAAAAASLHAAALPADLILWLLERLDGAGAITAIQCLRFDPVAMLGMGACLCVSAFLAERRLLRLPVPPAALRLLIAGALLIPIGQAPALLGQAMLEHRDAVRVTLFDVGQGQSVLVECGGGRILIDGGGSASPFFDCGKSILAPALTWGRLPWLDAVAVTHTDTDHARGLRWLLGHFSVRELCWSARSASGGESPDGTALRDIAEKRGIRERILARGDVLDLPRGFRLEVLWPPRGGEGRKRTANDDSLVLRLAREGRGLALFCGDVRAPALKDLLRLGGDLKAEVLVLPHHGASSSLLPEFYGAVAPELALASAGAFNQYGFPSAKVRQELERRGIPLLNTGEEGQLRVVWDFGGDAPGRRTVEAPFRQDRPLTASTPMAESSSSTACPSLGMFCSQTGESPSSMVW